MPAVFALIGAVLTWIALYQGFMAYVIAPPRDGELASVTGLLRHVDQPVTRNRFVPALELQIETAPARLVRIPVRLETLARDDAMALVGTQVTATSAQGRPRNRWLYALAATDRSIVALETERARDASARRRASVLALASSLAAGAIYGAAAMLHRRRGRRTRNPSHPL